MANPPKEIAITTECAVSEAIVASEKAINPSRGGGKGVGEATRLKSLCIHRGNRTEILLFATNDGAPSASCVEKRLLAFADVSTERHLLFREAIMQRLGGGPGVIPVDAPCPGQLAEEEMRSLTRIYVAGHTLKELRLSAELPPLKCLALVAELAETLARLHSLVDERAEPLGFIHRDITPSNVIVDLEGNAWLNDFGLALTNYELPLAEDETLQGARRFLAPELVRGEQPSAASDVYQLGLLAAYLLDPRRSEPPLVLEERADWAIALLEPFAASTSIASLPCDRPSAGEFALLLRATIAS